MRKEFGKALRALFSKAMKERLPLFREVKVTSIYCGPGERAFCREVSPSLRLWIVLSPSPRDYDMFTILVGWSRRDRYPELSMIPSIRMPDEGHGEFDEAEYLTRLPSLWSHNDTWWVIREPLQEVTIEALMKQLEPIPPEEAQRLVAPLVDDSLQALERNALPYFELLQE
ncbi:MAG: hypothetical protein AB9903_17350 [Vulcanimicrobiota bacterium]